MLDLLARIVAPVQQQRRRDVLSPQIGRPLLGKAEPQSIESAAGGSHLAFQVFRRQLARLGHVPHADQQVGRPAIVAHRGERRILGHRQSPLGARVHAVRIGLRTVRPDAAIIERSDHRAVAFRVKVDAGLADDRASTALCTLRRPADGVLADLVPVARRRHRHLSRDLGKIRVRDEFVRRLRPVAAGRFNRAHVGFLRR